MASDNIPLLFVSDLSFLAAKEKGIMMEALDKAFSNESTLEKICADDISCIVGRKVCPREWSAAESVKNAKKAAFWIRALDIGIITDKEDGYPPLLREADDRPFALFFRGDAECLSRKTVSVVGTRRVTPRGRIAAEEFSHDASEDGVCVVSGLALGVDGAAHKGAVKAVYDAMDSGESGPLGKNIAVLPCGVDIITPAMHKHLAQNIMYTHGCLISEYLPGIAAEPWRFVHRNRIIAGMSEATLVVEAPPGSGALITAQYALDYNREVVFHEAAFSDEAMEVSEYIKEQLEIKHAQGKASKSKLENTARKYIDDGAAIVKSYADFCIYMKEAPGIRIAQEESTLFDSGAEQDDGDVKDSGNSNGNAEEATDNENGNG